MDSVQQSSEYLVQWPSWLSGLIALGLMAALYSLLAEVLRKRYGMKAVWITAVAFAALLGTLVGLAMVRSVESPSLFLGAITLAITLGAIFIAPAYGISIGARRASPGLLQQVGRGVLTAYGFLAGAALVLIIIRIIMGSARR